MDPELSTWYHERREKIVRHSWEQAFWGSLLVVIVLMGLALVVMAAMAPCSRPIVLIAIGWAAIVACVRYGIIWYGTRKLKLEFAKKAMIQ